MKRMLLIGNPNSGKTTLFNALTGLHEPTGNWPGVTVEKKMAEVALEKHDFELLDLPGIYSFTFLNDNVAADLLITANGLLNEPWDLIINVLDATSLERHLYLTTQLLELNRPMVIALNKMGAVKRQGIQIDVKELEAKLNCPVVPIDAEKGEGIISLKERLVDIFTNFSLSIFTLPLKDALADKYAKLCDELSEANVPFPQFVASRFLEGDLSLSARFSHLQEMTSIVSEDDDILMADSRYALVHTLVEKVLNRKEDKKSRMTHAIDEIVLNRYLAIPIFLTMLYGVFFFAVHVGGYFQRLFDDVLTEWLVVNFATFLSFIHAPSWVVALLAWGAGRGVATTLSFIPIMGALFLALSLLEASGYMARAAFVGDRFMRFLGLPGKAFVPMIVGFGCNVPAIVGTRTLDSKRERLLTILMSPFMSCSARLAIYAVFASTFFPENGQNIVFALYLIGIVMAIGTGFFLRHSLLRGTMSPLCLEMPCYRLPSLKPLMSHVGRKLKAFILRALRLIVPVCVLLGAVSMLSFKGALLHESSQSQSLLSFFGQSVAPFFSPMGISESNWPAVVSLFTGLLAKEVVIGTLSSLYTEASHGFQMFGTMNAYMLNQFDGQAGAFSYLLLILLYIPCISSMAVIREEAGSKWMWFSAIWSCLVAYSTAVIFYQMARFYQHPLESLFWIGLMLFLTGSFILGVRISGRKYVASYS